MACACNPSTGGKDRRTHQPFYPMWWKAIGTGPLPCTFTRTGMWTLTHAYRYVLHKIHSFTNVKCIHHFVCYLRIYVHLTIIFLFIYSLSSINLLSVSHVCHSSQSFLCLSIISLTSIHLSTHLFLCLSTFTKLLPIDVSPIHQCVYQLLTCNLPVNHPFIYPSSHLIKSWISSLWRQTGPRCPDVRHVDPGTSWASESLSSRRAGYTVQAQWQEEVVTQLKAVRQAIALPLLGDGQSLPVQTPHHISKALCSTKTAYVNVKFLTNTVRGIPSLVLIQPSFHWRVTLFKGGMNALEI